MLKIQLWIAESDHYKIIQKFTIALLFFFIYRSRLRRSYGKYKCPFCDVIFSDKHEYARHFNKHNETKATRNGSVLKIEEAPLICKYCDKRFDKIFGLLAHSKLHTENQTPDPKTNNNCLYCKQALLSRSALKSHILKIHRGLPLSFSGWYFIIKISK